jgi:uncharacterized protein involved in exopolysaccharide biosynthesis
MTTTAPAASTRPRDPDTFDIVSTVRALVEAARYHWKLVLATGLGTLALSVIYVYVWPPIYVAEALIVAESENDTAREAFYNTWNIFRKDSARTEIELMMSGEVLKQVVELEKLTYDDVYHPVMSQLGYLWEKSWPGRAYKEVKSWVFGPEEGDDLDQATKDLGRTILDMRAGLQILPIGESTAGRVIMKGPSKRVADVVNTLLRVYNKSRGERHMGEAKLAYDSLSAEVEKARNELAAVSARRVAFLDRNALVFDLQKETQEVKTLSELETNAIMTRQKIASVEATLRSVEKALEQQGPMTKLQTVTEVNSLRENASQRRQDLQAQLILTLNRYRADSPEVAELRESIAKFDELIASSPARIERGSTEGQNSIYQQLALNRNTLKADLEGAIASLNSLESSATKLRASLVRVPALQDELRVLDRLYGSSAEKFQTLLGKRQLVEVAMATAAATSPTLKVVDYAVAPMTRYWPRLKILYPAALALGLLLGLLAAQIMRLAGGRVRPGAWGRRDNDAPVYGSVVLPAVPPVTLVRIASGGSGSTSPAAE